MTNTEKVVNSLIVALILVAWLGIPSFFWFFWPKSDLSGINSGIAGDTFGTVNALFSGFAFLGIILTLRQHASQSERTAFEQTFFNLLNSYETFTSSLDPRMIGDKFNGGPAVAKELYGREALLEYYGQLMGKLKMNTPINNPNCVTSIKAQYESFYDEAKPRLFQVFEQIHGIVNYVDRTKASIDKLEYIDMLKAHISPQELCLLLYHGSREKESIRLRPLIEKYGLLEHLHEKDLVDAKHKDLLDKTAYLKPSHAKV